MVMKCAIIYTIETTTRQKEKYMKLETRILINGNEIIRKERNFIDVENNEEFELNAPQKNQVIEDVINQVYEQKITPQNLKRDGVVVCYTVEEKYFITYKVSMGMVGINIEEI
jgi:hypothetical protein